MLVGGGKKDKTSCTVTPSAYLHEARARRADFLSARIAPRSQMGKEEVGFTVNSHKTLKVC